MAYRFRDPTPVFDNLLGTDPAPFVAVATTLDEIAGAWAAARGV